MPHAHQEPTLDGLAVTAAFAVAGGTAEVNGSEIGGVRVEQRQRRVSVGPAGGVSGMVPANAGADAVAEAPELGLSPDESMQIVGMREDGVGVGVRDPEGLVEQALLAGAPQGIVGM